jgi:hypothetical protein
MTEVYITFDTLHSTWNVMADMLCVFYNPDVLQIDLWLEKNADQYYEEI